MIDYNTFSFCESLTKIEIPKSVTKIKGSAFGGCTNLQSVYLPEGLSAVEDNTFFICYELKNIGLPKSIKKIGDFAFYNCKKIQNVFFGGTEIERGNIIIDKNYSNFFNATWHYNYNEQDVICLPKNTTVIEQNAFQNTSASIYIIPEGTITIMEKAFSNLNKAAKIYLPSSVTSIDDSAFYGSERALYICPNTTCTAYTWAKDKGFQVIVLNFPISK